MDWIHSVNVYSCMLCEATGDSEADSDMNKDMDTGLLAQDDAQSCSCEDAVEFGDSDDHRGTVDADDDENVDGDWDQLEETILDLEDVDNDDEDDELDDDEDAVDIGTVNKEKKLKVCADSVKELMIRNDHQLQRDKDRLFWETCLAS